jgi:prepilin-type processing-associated H-X9-DG protein
MTRRSPTRRVMNFAAVGGGRRGGLAYKVRPRVQSSIDEHDEPGNDRGRWIANAVFLDGHARAVDFLGIGNPFRASTDDFKRQARIDRISSQKNRRLQPQIKTPTGASRRPRLRPSDRATAACQLPRRGDIIVGFASEGFLTPKHSAGLRGSLASAPQIADGAS